ncbi:MAG: hypothetical protein Q8S18_01240 [Bacteroidales bacterium]|nr:hypothetical protein [Bacteroidales bacterium]
MLNGWLSGSRSSLLSATPISVPLYGPSSRMLTKSARSNAP